MPPCPPSEKCVFGCFFFSFKKMKCRSSYKGTERSCDRTGESCRCRCMTRGSRVRTEGGGETGKSISGSFLPKLAWRCTRRALWSDRIYGGAGRCHKQAHTAHPRKNKKKGERRRAQDIKKKKKRRKESSALWAVQAKVSPGLFKSSSLLLQIRDWMLVPHKAKGWRREVAGLLLLERTCGHVQTVYITAVCACAAGT